MKPNKLLLTICLTLAINYASAQLCTQDDRFIDPQYFSNTQIDSIKNVSYGKVLNYKGDAIDLQMDLYFPNNSIDTMAKRPFILLMHGGGWHGGSREQFSYQCREFAKRGYVTATMSYRLGYDKDVEGDYMRAIYRGQQDANSAMRYIAANAQAFKVDNSWLFFGGSSAGAVTSFLISYASQEEWNKISTEFESALGRLDSSGNELKQAFEIKGIYNLMGSVQPLVLQVEDLIPTISFHGELDKGVPIGKSKKGYGSSAIHDILNEEGICNDLTIVTGGGHNIYLNQEGEDFMINRVAKFYKSLFCGTCTSSTFNDERFADLNEVNEKIIAAIKEGEIENLDSLITKDAIYQCHATYGGYYNYLYLSVMFESQESLKYFVSRDANLELRCGGKTALMYAAKSGQLDAVKFLLENGADLNTTHEGKTALDYAEKYEQTEIKKYLKEYKSE